jgi:excisionase family DNA binding protein
MSETNHMLTVEEAATRIGVSVATVRRMAKSGRLSATKSGRQWLIDGRSLPTGRSRRPSRRSARSSADVELALSHVCATDLAELLVPDVLRYEDLLAPTAKADVLAAAESRFDGTPFEPAMEVEVDKTPFSTRTALLPTLEDRVAYQAAVAAVAPQIESQTPENVFSARLSDDVRFFLRHGPRQWVAWRRAVLGELADGSDWLVKTDLTSYFDLIPHRTLNAEIQSLNPPSAVADALSELLRTWAVVPGIGIAQGPNASRLLANLYLHPVDREMLRAGFRYYRYLDDVRIVCSSRGEAVRAIRLFERECRALGLVVSGAKTQLLRGTAARDDLAPAADFDAAQYFMDVNAASFARKALKRILRRSLRASGITDVRGVRFSLWRLAQIREGSVLTRVLRRLEDLAPVASVVAAYLLPFIRRGHVVRSLAAFLGDAERCQSPFLATWLFAVMLHYPSTLPAVWVEQAMARLRDRNEPAYLRAVAAVVAARGNRAADVGWIKSDVQRERDPHVLRGYAVGLHSVEQLDRTTQKRLIARDGRLRHTVDYLQGRTTLPSLIYRSHDQRIRVRP